MSFHQSSNPIDELQFSTQVVFQEPIDKRLTPPKGVDPDEWATHLAHISSREPGNLLNHVRRIYLHLALKQSDALYGAMLDLFLVLGDKGGRLRRHLLDKAGNLLSQEEHDLFLTFSKPGLRSDQPLPPSQHSVLGNFFGGELGFIEVHDNQDQSDNHEIDPMESAREELNYGNTAGAQQILEEAILKFPDRLELHHSLLEIYKHTRSLDDFQNMKRRLGDDIGIAQAAWNQTGQSIVNSGQQ
jgi:hypothetical protein